MSEAHKGHLAMLIFSALVAGSFSLGSQVANEIAPTALNAVRFLIASAVIGAAVLVLQPVPRSAFQAPWRYVVLGGLFATYFVLMFEGLKTAPPVSASAVFTLTPIMAAGFGWILLRQITTPGIALGLALGACGALWVIFRADLTALLSFEVGQGEIIYFWGCVAHAAYTPAVRWLNRGESPLVFTLGVLIAGTMLLTAVGWTEIVGTNWSELSAFVWIAILYVAIGASAATFVLLQYAALRLPSAKVMAYTYLTPSWVILWEIGFGNGAPQPVILVGIAMTMLALWVLLREAHGA